LLGGERGRGKCNGTTRKETFKSTTGRAGVRGVGGERNKTGETFRAGGERCTHWFVRPWGTRSKMRDKPKEHATGSNTEGRRRK